METGILNYLAERRCRMTVDNGMQLQLGEADLVKRPQQLGEILCGLLAHGGELDAVEQFGMARGGHCRQTQGAARGGCERGETKGVATADHDLLHKTNIPKFLIGCGSI